MSKPDHDASGAPIPKTAAVFTLVVATLLYVINYMDRMVLSSTLPLIQQDLALTDTQCGWLGTWGQRCCANSANSKTGLTSQDVRP